MIVIIQTKNKNQLLIKALALSSLVIMFGWYYLHMSTKFQDTKEELTTEFTSQTVHKETNKSITIEKTIYKEAVTIVNLLEQKHIQSIKVIEDKLFIICDFTTDIEPLMIRYGVAAMIKNSPKNIKIAIDLRTIVENKFEA